MYETSRVVVWDGDRVTLIVSEGSDEKVFVSDLLVVGVRVVVNDTICEEDLDFDLSDDVVTVFESEISFDSALREIDSVRVSVNELVMSFVAEDDKE